MNLGVCEIYKTNVPAVADDSSVGFAVLEGIFKKLPWWSHVNPVIKFPSAFLDFNFPREYRSSNKSRCCFAVEFVNSRNPAPPTAPCTQILGITTSTTFSCNSVTWMGRAAGSPPTFRGPECLRSLDPKFAPFLWPPMPAWCATTCGKRGPLPCYGRFSVFGFHGGRFVCHDGRLDGLEWLSFPSGPIMHHNCKSILFSST